MFGRLDASNVHCSVVVCLVDGWYFLSSPPSLPRLLSLSLSYDERVNKQAQATSATDKRQEKKAKRRHIEHASSAFEIILFYHCAF